MGPTITTAMPIILPTTHLTKNRQMQKSKRPHRVWKESFPPFKPEAPPLSSSPTILTTNVKYHRQSMKCNNYFLGREPVTNLP